MSDAVSEYVPVRVTSISSPTGNGRVISPTVGATLATVTQAFTTPLVAPSSSTTSKAITCVPDSDQ